jgi:hypothetical protein
MTRQEVIDSFKKELSKSYIIRVTSYKDGQTVNTTDTEYPNSILNFERPVIEAALALLEEQYDL